MKRVVGISLAIIGFILFFGCETHYITQKAKQIQPYQKGDILIFQKNSKIIDTIWITDIDKYVNPDDPLDIFPTRYQTMSVSGEISMRKIKKDIYDRPITKEYQQLLEIDSNKNKDDSFLFVFDNKNEPFRNPTTMKSLTELTKCFNANNSLCNIPAKEHYSNVSSHDHDLVKFTWSKSYGYTRFNYANGDEYRLIEYWRNNNNILN